MIPTTQDYKNSIYSTYRTPAGKVVFQIVDITASGDAIVTVTGESLFSRKSQAVDTNVIQSTKIATFEQNYWKLDGSFALPPKPTEGNAEIGWWSNDICSSDGTFSVSQVLTVQFTKDHTSIGITISFDEAANEYASNFTITVYDASNNVVFTQAVTGNTQSRYSVQQLISNYRKVVITITKWANGNRRARVFEVGFGLILDYASLSLVNMSVLEDLDTLAAQVSSNELQFAINNQDKSFNILNPTGLYPYLQRKQKIQPYLGVARSDGSIEYIPMGTFYLNEWKSDEGALTASFIARDMLDLLSQSIYRKGKYQTRSLYNLALDVFADAGILDYTIDTALQGINVTGCIPIVSHREALQMIALAGMAVCYCDRYGKVTIKQLLNVSTGETINYNNTFSSPLIKLDQLINTVDINVYSYTPRTAPEQVYSGTISINGTSSVWIEYTESPAQGVTATVTGGTLNSATYYGNAALLNITASGNVTITATGTVLDQGSSIYEIKDASAAVGESSLPITADNPLISDNTIAANVANWVMAEYKKRFLYEVNWRMNPALEAGDIVTVQDDYAANKTMRITKQEFTYQGYIEGKTSGRGGGT